MDTFEIDPQACLILKALRDSASLREAAIRLGRDAAGLARAVQSISRETGLVQKVNNRWMVTPRGLDLIVWAEDSIASQRQILKNKSSLGIASTTWLAEQLLIPAAERLAKSLTPSRTVAFTVPDDGFETCLLEGRVDFVVVCHPPENPEIEHRQLSPEAWTVALHPSMKPKRSQNASTLEALAKHPFIVHRHLDLDQFLPGVRTEPAALSFDNLVGVRAALRAGQGWSVVPRLLVKEDLETGRLDEIPNVIEMKDRKVCLWWLRNRRAVRAEAPKLASWLRAALE